VPKVRLIDAEGEQMGIVDIDTAMAKARESTLDLVEISPNAEPPVCKIMDHGRFKFEMNKKQHSANLSEYATVEQFPKMEGRQMVMVMAPHKNKPKSEGGGGGASSSPSTSSAAPKAAESKPAAAKPADNASAEAAARQAAEDEAVRAAEAQVQAQVAARQANND